MRIDQIEQFKKEFKSICYLKSEIASRDTKLKSLYAWDKNDSHKNAILKELDHRSKLKEDLNKKLKGETYEKWRDYSSLLIKVTKRYFAAKESMEKWELEIFKINIADIDNSKVN